MRQHHEEIVLIQFYCFYHNQLHNFQFMPSTIENYAIDYDKNGKIELKLKE